MRRHPAARVVAVIVSALLVALSLGRLLPPHSMAMLLARVVTTEYSPLVALADIAWLLVAWWALRGTRRTALACMAVLLVAGAVALMPLARFGEVASAAAAQLGSTPAGYSPFARGADGARIAERSIAYRAADGTPLTMRLFAAARPGPRPTVVVIYGGAWRGGDATQSSAASRALAAHGYTVAAIDYRHAPAARFPAQLLDVRGSIALLHDSSAAWHVDTTRIALLGRSSGGHLAELAAWAPGAPAIRAVVAIYAPFDLMQGYDDLPSPDPIGVRAVLRDFIGGTPADARERYVQASPATFVRPGLPPTLLLFGGGDHVVKPAFNRGAAALLRRAGDRVVEVEVPWAEHGFDMAPAGLGTQLAGRIVAEFLDRELGARQ